MRDLQQLLDELKDMSFFNPGEMCIIGCSTSEVIGKRIGSVGSMDVAKEIYENLKQLEIDTGVTFAFQGCEHINRAVTIDRANFNPLTMEEVTVIQTFMQVVVYPLTLINKWKILLLLSILLFQKV